MSARPRPAAASPNAVAGSLSNRVRTRPEKCTSPAKDIVNSPAGRAVAERAVDFAAEPVGIGVCGGFCPAAGRLVADVQAASNTMTTASTTGRTRRARECGRCTPLASRAAPLPLAATPRESPLSASARTSEPAESVPVAAGQTAFDALAAAGLETNGPGAPVVVRAADGTLHDLNWTPESDTVVAPVTAASAGGAGGAAPLHGTRDGAGGAGAVSRHAARHRPADRGRLLLRLPA